MFSCWLLQDDTQITSTTTTLTLTQSQTALAVFTEVQGPAKSQSTSLSIYLVFVASLFLISTLGYYALRVGTRLRKSGLWNPRQFEET